MIPTIYLRSSSLKDWLECPIKYYLRYCLGILFPSGPSAKIGSTVHKIIEILANIKQHEQAGTLADINYFDPETGWQCPGIDTINDIDIGKLSQFVYDYYTKDIKPEDIPKTYQRKDPRKSLNAWIPFKKVTTALENLFAMSPRSFDVRQLNVYDCEHKFDIEIKEDWSKYQFTFRGKEYKGNLRFKGSIDLIIKNEDDTYSIVDWKTGDPVNHATGEEKTYEEFYDDIQGQLYYLIATKYLGLNVRDVTFVYPVANKCFTVVYEDDDSILERIRKIYFNMQQTQVVEPNKTDLCMKLCPYFKNTFDAVTTEPRVKPREYIWENPETALVEKKEYRICGQCSLYCKDNNPEYIMDILARKDFNIGQYTNS